MELIKTKTFKEEWKDVPEMNGYYQVSNKGQVKSISRIVLVRGSFVGIRKDKFLKPKFRGKGYLAATLNGKAYSIHRLVMCAFTDKPLSYEYHVNHKNEIKTDNSLENLEWCTNKYNSSYGSKPEKISKTFSKFRVKQINADGQLLKIWDNSETTKLFGYNPSHVHKCCKGERITHKKCFWQYDNSSINPTFTHNLLSKALKIVA